MAFKQKRKSGRVFSLNALLRRDKNSSSSLPCAVSFSPPPPGAACATVCEKKERRRRNEGGGLWLRNRSTEELCHLPQTRHPSLLSLNLDCFCLSVRLATPRFALLAFSTPCDDQEKSSRRDRYGDALRQCFNPTCETGDMLPPAHVQYPLYDLNTPSGKTHNATQQLGLGE